MPTPDAGASRDVLGLRRPGGGALLVVVGAMAFVATLAVAGEGAARLSAKRLLAEAEPSRTALVPRPDERLSGSTRIEAALTTLRADPTVAEARPLTLAEIGELVRPWLGPNAGKLGGLDLPGVVAVTLRPGAPAESTGSTLSQAVAGATLADQDERLGALSRVLLVARGLAVAALLAIAVATALVVGVATRAAVLQRREMLEIAHGLGAEDGWIAGRLARAGAKRAAAGAIGGTALALPPIALLAWLLPTLLGAPPAGWDGVPRTIWLEFAAVPVVAALVGYVVAARVARGWLRRLA